MTHHATLTSYHPRSTHHLADVASRVTSYTLTQTLRHIYFNRLCHFIDVISIFITKNACQHRCRHAIKDPTRHSFRHYLQHHRHVNYKDLRTANMDELNNLLRIEQLCHNLRQQQQQQSDTPSG